MPHPLLQVFSSILKRHFKEYRGPRRLTDYCQICANFDDEVVPQLTKLLAASRVELETLCPSYFKEWDNFATTQDYHPRPALHCNDFEHFVKQHDRRQPCRRHRGKQLSLWTSICTWSPPMQGHVVFARSGNRSGGRSSSYGQACFQLQFPSSFK